MTVRVLHQRDFDDLDSLLLAAGGEPTVLVVSSDVVQELIPQLASDQDLVTDSAPELLIEHRRARLAASTGLGRDVLTGLWSRQPFLTSLENWPPLNVARPVRSLLVLDLDGFKAVNDQHGHDVGDAVLAEVAARVSATIPEGASAARIGGEEIGVLLRGGRDEAGALALRLHSAIGSRPFTDRALHVTTSVGVATAGASVDGRTLLKKVDGALYAAKAAGRDRVLHASDLEREAIENDIDPAIQGFENLTRVISGRVADLLSRRSRVLFEELQRQAEVDALTGLYTRRYLDRRLSFEVEEATGRFAAALLDIDHFGKVNSDHGWPSGDRVLAAVAARIVAGVRDTDWVARYGGEEFLVVLPRTTLSEARSVLERVRLRVNSHTIDTTDRTPLQITLSAGVAELAEGEGLSAFMERISSKLLRAKSGGRDRVVG